MDRVGEAQGHEGTFSLARVHHASRNDVFRCRKLPLKQNRQKEEERHHWKRTDRTHLIKPLDPGQRPIYGKHGRADRTCPGCRRPHPDQGRPPRPAGPGPAKQRSFRKESHGQEPVDGTPKAQGAGARRGSAAPGGRDPARCSPPNRWAGGKRGSFVLYNPSNCLF